METLKVAVNMTEIQGKVMNTTVTLEMALSTSEKLLCPRDSLNAIESPEINGSFGKLSELH